MAIRNQATGKWALRFTDWREEYTSLIKGLGAECKDAAGAGKRRHPRFKVDPKINIPVELDQKIFQVLDVSAAGISLASAEPYPLGYQYRVRFGEKFSGLVRIIHCQPGNDGKGHRVGARFVEEEMGYQCFVLIVKHVAAELKGS